MSVLLSGSKKSLLRVPFSISQTLNLIRFHLISPGFKYTFMPNLATAWKVREKVFESFPQEQPWVALLKHQCRDPHFFTCYPQNAQGVKEILCLTWPLAVLSLVTITKEPLSEPTHRLYYYSYNHSSILQSTVYCDKLKEEYKEVLLMLSGIIGLSEQKEFWYY